jgi:hypothetical protein
MTILDKLFYKSPLKKLVTFFEKSRDKWKEKYLGIKNENKLLKNKLSILKASKQKWKDETLLLRKQLKEVELCTKIVQTEPVKNDLIYQVTPLNEGNIQYHSYSATTIFLMLQMVLNAAVSLRGCERVLNIMNDVLNKPLASVPSWFSVRSWLLRLGYYNIMQEKIIADDWCWIIDHTIQLGKTKCLLILGTRLSKLPKDRSLQYKDLEAIDLLPVTTSTGDIVWQQLEKTATKTGIPRAIVSDCGSDIKLGVARFCKEHESCASLYDIKHKTACLLKAELNEDKDWQEFIKQASDTKKQLQQTPLSHIKPPNQRSKSRYMNIEILLTWAVETLKILENKRDFSEAEKEQLVKLEWLKTYKNKLQEWDELLRVGTLTEQCVRQEGITREVYQVLERQFQKNLPELKDSTAIKLKSNLIEFVKIQGLVCKEDERLLGSSEVIESIFGKQKYLEREYAKEGFTSLILGIGAFVGTLTVETVKEALIATPAKKIKKWYKEVLGETLQSKKNAAYSEVRNGTKTDSVYNCAT